MAVSVPAISTSSAVRVDVRKETLAAWTEWKETASEKRRRCLLRSRSILKMEDKKLRNDLNDLIFD